MGLLTRNELDWTHKYPPIAAAVAALPARQAYLDGELCGVRADGITSFSMIQMASDVGNAAGLVFFLFESSRPRRRGSQHPPSIEREERLAGLLAPANSPLQYSDHQIGLNPATFTKKPVPLGSKASSQNAPMRRMHPEIAACGSKSNASTARNSW
ncbi:MAG TPA: hypothetical protein VGR45_03930 [Stellaceae bacterium]|nr:hypothetical protein [Stellaceae bacterium]